MCIMKVNEMIDIYINVFYLNPLALFLETENPPTRSINKKSHYPADKDILQNNKRKSYCNPNQILHILCNTFTHKYLEIYSSTVNDRTF